MENNKNYVVASIKSWNIKQFHLFKENFAGNWYLITSKEELTDSFLDKINPRYIFFPHWSWIVPSSILSNWECVCFHMTDVPYGRGGSPLQNLISLGHKTTKLSALRMANELDAGPVYRKIPLSLDGTAEEIFQRAARLIINIIAYIAMNEPQPKEQKGEAIIFKRRTPEQSELPSIGNLSNIYDHIRMLDADTYPKAFLEHGEFRLEFDQAKLDNDGRLSARVKFVVVDKKI